MKNIKVRVKCVDCAARWWVGAGDVLPGDMPTCPECGGVGVAERAKAQNARRGEGS